MKKLFLILNTLICFELIAVPVVPGFASIFIQNAEARDCGAGLVWDEALNNCIVKTSTSQSFNAAKECENSENKEECYKKNAMDQMSKDSAADGNLAADLKKNGLTNVAAGLATVGALSIAIAGLKDSKGGQTCKSISYWLMIGGTASLVVGDLVANAMHDNKIKGIRNSWKDILAGEDSKGDKDKIKIAGIEAQSAAFGKLAELEDAMVKTSKTKSLLFNIAGGAFAGSAIAAGLELITKQDPMSALCNSKSSRSKQLAGKGDEELAEIAKGKGSNAKLAKDILSEKDAAKQIQTDQEKVKQDAIDLEEKKRIEARDKEKAEIKDRQENEGKTPEQIQKEKDEKRMREIEIEEHFESNPPDYDDASNTNGVTSQIKYNIQNSHDLVSLFMNFESQNLEYQSPSLDDYESLQDVYSVIEVDKTQLEMIKGIMVALISNVTPLPNAHAKDETLSENVYKKYEGRDVQASLYTLGGAAAAGIAIGTIFKPEWITTPTARAAFSGVLSGLSFKLASDASKQAKASEARGDHLRKLEKDLLDSTSQLGICRSEDRSNQAKPHCYCYTPDNYPNPSRKNSKICQGLHAGNTDIKAGEYHTLPGYSSTCVNNAYNADPGCACRKKNTCMKLNLSGIKALNPGVFTIMGNAVSPVQDIANGTYDPASVSPASLASNAAKLDALMKKVEKHPALKAYAKNKDKMQGEMMKSLSAGARNLPSSSLASSGSNALPSNPAEAAKQLDEELKKPSLGDQGTAVGSAAAPSESLEFGLSDSDFASQEDQIAEVMNKDFEYGANDINSGSTTNIFEVLSNRYQRSGLRRLFDEKGVAKPEPAAQSDITQ